MLDLPQDVVFDVPRITMIGNLQLYVENYRGVVQFSETGLILELSQGKLEVVGKRLSIRAILPEEVFIEGEIEQVSFL